MVLLLATSPEPEKTVDYFCAVCRRTRTYFYVKDSDHLSADRLLGLHLWHIHKLLRTLDGRLTWLTEVPPSLDPVY